MFLPHKWFTGPLYKRLVRPLLPHKVSIRLDFRYRVGKPLNLHLPMTFNEKIQWIKLYDKNPLMPLYADKYEVRNVVRSKVGTHILNELYGVFESVDEIDFDLLPESFVLKANHASGWNVIVRNKSALDVEETKKKIRKWLTSRYAERKMEWAYENIPARIVCEKYMGNEGGSINDYKFFCFNGDPRFIQVDLDRYTQHTRAFYTLEWRKLDFFTICKDCSYYEKEVKRPDSLEDMIGIARVLSSDFTFARVDMYDVGGKAIFGEVTFYPGSGMERFSPERWDKEFGELLQLPERLLED